jgi:hypothetical protein
MSFPAAVSCVLQVPQWEFYGVNSLSPTGSRSPGSGGLKSLLHGCSSWRSWYLGNGPIKDSAVDVDKRPMFRFQNKQKKKKKEKERKKSFRMLQRVTA